MYLYIKKVGSVPKCGDCKDKLRGVSTFLWLAKILDDKFIRTILDFLWLYLQEGSLLYV